MWHNEHMPIHRAKERVLMVHLYLRMTRRFNESYFPRSEGSSPSRRRVALVLFAGTALGGEPMRLTRIAREAGHMSHQTALRRLTELEQMGIVVRKRGGYCIAVDGAVNSLAAKIACDRNVTDIIRTAGKLQKLSNLDNPG